MSLFAPLAAALATKAGTVAAAGLTVAVGTAGVATVVNNAPEEELQPTVVEIQEDDEEELEGEAEGEELEDELEGEGESLEDEESDEGDEGPDEEGLENRSETANRVQEVVTDRDSYESGRDFGQAVSSAARGDDTEDGDEPGAQGRERAEQARSQDTEDEGTEEDEELKAEEEEAESDEDGDDLDDDEDDEPAEEANEGLSTADENRNAERP